MAGGSPLDDVAVVELLKRATQDSTGHASSEDLATLRQASNTAGPEQADMMAVWIAGTQPSVQPLGFGP